MPVIIPTGKPAVNRDVTEAFAATAWKSYRADEPSELYLKTTKIGGILFALSGVVMIILPFILK